jgi:hypothetical protein
MSLEDHDRIVRWDGCRTKLLRAGLPAGLTAARRVEGATLRGGTQGPASEEVDMKANVGDRIVVESEKVGQPGREGVIEEVLEGDPERVRVSWEDGHTSVLVPAAGAAKIVPAQTSRRR